MSVIRQMEIIEKLIDGSDSDNIRLKIRQRDDYLFKSAEYSANQTATEFIAAPGEGYKLVIKGGAIASSTNTGIVTINGTVDEATIIIAKLYASQFMRLADADISVELDENTAVTITSTTGANDIFVKANYVIREV